MLLEDSTGFIFGNWRILMKIKDYMRGVLTNMCVLLLPVLTYLILGPLEVYFGNTKNLDISYFDF